MIIIKPILVLLLDLLIYYVIGSGATGALCKRKLNMAIRVIFGFLFYQAVFEVCCLAFTLTYRELPQLARLWEIVCLILVICGLILGRKVIRNDLEHGKEHWKDAFGWKVAGLIVIGLLCVYVSVNGQLDTDSQYYIGVITTTLKTNYLFRINAYTGELLPSLYARRALVTYEMSTAVLCRIFGLQPIIAARVMRGSLNVILTALAGYELGKRFFAKKEHPETYGYQVMIAMFFSYLLLETTIYTNAEFLLHRAYEGKAFAGNVLIYYFMILAAEFWKSREKKLLLWWGISLWGCLAISSSAVVICGVETVILCGVLIIGTRMEKKKMQMQEK